MYSLTNELQDPFISEINISAQLLKTAEHVV